ncbi:MAG: sulfite exporter TauE/SafE family protein [Bacteroidia bacterium]
MEIAGYISAILIGISLGLIGGGGSALALPVLVYLFHVPAQKAVPDTLFIVGITSLTGAITYLYRNLISFRSVLVFGLPSILSVYFTRSWLTPQIPEILQFPGNLSIGKDVFLLIIFAFLMLAASFSMIRPARQDGNEKENTPLNYYPYVQMMLSGLCVGFLAGLVGAGGGFLIIPALVVLARLPMKTAIGTSLLIIAINSGIGFYGSLPALVSINWNFLIIFSSLSVLGIFIGMYLSHKVSGAALKPAFGWFILITGTFIILQQILNPH